MSLEPVVLYVEDDALSREIMGMIFKFDLGLSCFEIWPTSADFEERVKRMSPPANIILLDIHVRPVDGFEMLTILRGLEQYHEARVVALTASVMHEEVQRLRGAGFNGAIAKPIDQDHFPDTFERIVSGEEVWRIIA